MKTVLLAPLPPPYGGIAEWTQRMLSARLENGWTLDIVDEKVSERRGTYSKKRNIKEEIQRSVRIWQGLKQKLEDEDVKLVHCCIPATPFAMIREYVSCCITKRHNRKFIMHFRCTVPNMVKGGFSQRILKSLCKKSDCIMVLNHQTEQYLRAITDTPCVVIPNFVDCAEIDAGETYHVRDEIRKAVYVGGVMPSKGCDDIVRLASKFPTIQFEMVGMVENSINEMVKEMNIQNVILPGAMPHNEVLKHIEDADIFVFLSHYEGEGFSNALVEAMAMGIPCIVSDWAANKDMVENCGGVVIPVQDVDAATRALEYMKPMEVREKMSQWNHDKVKKAYTANIVTSMYVRVYEQLVLDAGKR